ncbi:hypothetical protein [Beduini massiliensis]|uniref:hypothetical protein n=1 Tax=Beduini massiliensis TaxID=1585974 RepID=UPI00059A9CE6|nr:hypothetical protein [Beduini massiliensis]
MVDENIESLQIKFEGTNDIDIETFSTALKNTVSLLKTIASEVLQEEQFCKFKIKDVKKGSFTIDILAVILSNYPAIISAMPTVLTTFKTILEIKKHLNGSDPKSVRAIDENNVEITNNYGTVNNFNRAVINIYANNDQIEKALVNTFNKISTDNDRKGISFAVNDNNENYSKVEFTVEDVLEAKKPIDAAKLVNDIEEVVAETIVTVTKPDLYGSSKWQVFFGTIKINATVTDTDFLNRVHNNEIPFLGSTKLKVKLKSKYKINEFGLPIEGTQSDYTIIEVLDVINVDKNENMSLF